MSERNVYKNESRKSYNLTREKRDIYRKISLDSRNKKNQAEMGLISSIHPINKPKLDPGKLMPQLNSNGFRTLSLFSGGGGLDLGFDRAGFQHEGSYEIIPICGDTLAVNRPEWNIYAGPEKGDVTSVDWRNYRGKIDVIHGGPPCQPFSIAGEQRGEKDDRNMWSEFITAINVIKPKAFVAENVLGILNPKFREFVNLHILKKLPNYKIHMFELNAVDFGIPQIRRRVFFVGFTTRKRFNFFKPPEPTHAWLDNSCNAKENSLFGNLYLEPTIGVREALGLSNIGYDILAPTLRSGFTGKRNTTSILNSSAGQRIWGSVKIWPNGVQATREKASAFPAKEDHFRLSVQDCALLQGFPENWKFSGAVYQVLGQIGNSVVPPVAYKVAEKVADSLKV